MDLFSYENNKFEFGIINIEKSVKIMNVKKKLI